MVQMNNIVWSGRFYFDASNNMESIWHVDAFNDPIDNKDSKEDRADVLIEDYAEKLNLKAIKEIEKRSPFWWCFNEVNLYQQYKSSWI
jgi:glycyl-tRNA synthetase